MSNYTCDDDIALVCSCTNNMTIEIRANAMLGAYCNEEKVMCKVSSDKGEIYVFVPLSQMRDVFRYCAKAYRKKYCKKRDGVVYCKHTRLRGT